MTLKAKRPKTLRCQFGNFYDAKKVRNSYDNFNDPHTQSYAQKFTITDTLLSLNGGPTPFAAFSCPKSVVYGAAAAQAAAGGYGQIGFRSALI